MYEVSVTSSFSGAHFLREYRGKCESLHGHNWRVQVTVSAAELDSLGLVMDFGDLKKILDELIEEFDHRLLNEHDYFKTNNPTSEHIAYFLFTNIKTKIPRHCRLDKVKVWEKDTSCATYHE
jgi:6-pyruvoyltetrahydropterin/6-carboxytetrahydropterin synthase